MRRQSFQYLSRRMGKLGMLCMTNDRCKRSIVIEKNGNLAITLRNLVDMFKRRWNHVPLKLRESHRHKS